MAQLFTTTFYYDQTTINNLLKYNKNILIHFFVKLEYLKIEKLRYLFAAFVSVMTFA